MSVELLERTMPKREDTPVRITNEALEKIRVAAAFTGRTLSEYISASMIPIAEKDIEEGYARLGKPKPRPKARP